MIEYAIPSRGRAEVLVAKTLPLLDRLGVVRQAHVFVAEEEIPAYEEALIAAGYGSVPVWKGGVGMAAQRAMIHSAYDEGDRFISIDDDLRDLVVRRDERTLAPIEPDEWGDLVDSAFSLCRTVGARLWGLYPVPNPYFMRSRWRTDLRYIGGGLWGCINRRVDDALAVELEDKEDFERSLRCYAADGAVVRCEYVSWRTTGYQGAGGMQADGLRTDERIRSSAEILAERYPSLATLNLTKKSGKAELRLRDRRPV